MEGVRALNNPIGMNNIGSVSVMYFNARSLIPKFDELCLLVEFHKPDLVSIVESWFCADIPEDEFCIQGYNLFRKDRNRHGGGVLMYIKNHFMAEVLPSHNFCNLEILSIVVRHLKFKICITVFYRPP